MTMRCAPFVLFFALVLGAGAGAALADENEPLVPAMRAEPQIVPQAHIKQQRARKPQTRVHAAPKSAAAHARAPLPKPAPQPGSGGIGRAKQQVLKSPASKTEITGATRAAASDVLAGIPADERLKIQSALFWSGDYTGANGSEDPMRTAIKNYQKRHKAKVTGELTPAERANLVAAAGAHERKFGWTVVVDPATGVRIGLPGRLVPQAHDAARGTRWSSAHGEVQVETFRIRDRSVTLAELFEREKRAPPTRRVEYSVLHDDSFMISGMQGLKYFSVRAAARDGEARGFTMLYDQAMEGIVAPVMVAMASAFAPFPERSAPLAALSKSVEYGNGIVVSARGHIVTDRRLVQGCQVIRAANGDADLVASDKDKGLALLRVYGREHLAPVALDAAANDKTGDLRLVGMPEPRQGDARVAFAEIKARLAGGAAIELRQPAPLAGLSGAAALDAQGRFVGLMEMRGIVLASNEPAAPPVRLVTAVAIRDFLAEHHVPVAQGAGTDARASVVRVICVRK